MAALTARAGNASPSLLDRVFQPATLAALERVRLRVPHASGERPGHTRVRNRTDESGSEVERYTPYHPGDDLRRIDWNAYARLGELLMRRFVAEREVPVWIFVDTSASMGPAGAGSKLDMAAALAGLLAVVSLAGGDRVYLSAIPGHARAGESAVRTCGPLRARRSLHAVHGFLTSLVPAAGTPTPLANALERATVALRRGLVVLISDFLFPVEEIDATLEVLARRRCDGKIIQVLSREDRDPSWLRGSDKLVDRETGQTYSLESSVEVWRRYEEALDDQIRAVRSATLARGMSSVVAINDVELDELLRTELPRLGLSLVR
jgi:uncharacterized protein (DUF58 family)